MAQDHATLPAEQDSGQTLPSSPSIYSEAGRRAILAELDEMVADRREDTVTYQSLMATIMKDSGSENDLRPKRIKQESSELRRTALNILATLDRSDAPTMKVKETTPEVAKPVPKAVVKTPAVSRKKTKTEPAERPRVEIKRWGNFLTPETSLTEEALGAKIIKILNGDEVNNITEQSVNQFGMPSSKIIKMVIEKSDSVSFDGIELKTDSYINRVLNELLFSYLHQPLDLELLYNKCNVVVEDIPDSDVNAGLAKLHKLLVRLKKRKIIAYNEKQPHQVTFLPLHIEEKDL